MSPREEKLLEFVALRLDSLVHRPALWGTDAVVEEQVLQLVEMRRLLLDPMAAPSNDTRALMDSYLAFLVRELGEPTPESLAAQLERAGRSVELGGILHKFVESDLAQFVASVSGPRTVEAEDSESSDRAIAVLGRVKRSIAAMTAVERQRAHRAEHTPLLFPPRLEPR